MAALTPGLEQGPVPQVEFPCMRWKVGRAATWEWGKSWRTERRTRRAKRVVRRPDRSTRATWSDIYFIFAPDYRLG
jgi:hypothetical protein